MKNLEAYTGGMAYIQWGLYIHKRHYSKFLVLNFTIIDSFQHSLCFVCGLTLFVYCFFERFHQPIVLTCNNCWNNQDCITKERKDRVFVSSKTVNLQHDLNIRLRQGRQKGTFCQLFFPTLSIYFQFPHGVLA